MSNDTMNAISDDFKARAGQHFNLETLEDILSDHGVDGDRYDLKSIRAAVGYPTNYGSFVYVFDWQGDGGFLADLFEQNVLRSVYIVDCGEMRNVRRLDPGNGDPIWRPTGRSLVIGHFDSLEEARRVYEATSPRDEWLAHATCKRNAVYVELYENQLDSMGNVYGTGRIAEKSFYFAGAGNAKPVAA